MKMPKWLRAYLDKRADIKRRAAIKSDFKCVHCDRWIKAEQLEAGVKETTWHWIMICKCGGHTPFFLGAMMPIHNTGAEGFPDWRAELKAEHPTYQLPEPM